MSIQKPVCSNPDKITACYEKANYQCPDTAYCPWECQVNECKAGCVDSEGNVDQECRDMCQIAAWMPVCLQVVCRSGCLACSDSECTSSCPTLCTSSCKETCDYLKEASSHSSSWLSTCKSYCTF